MIEQLYKPFQHWSEKGTVWVYSDPHFGDADIQAAYPNRPTDEEQIKLINSSVGKNDTLILLGDVGDTACASQLKGYKVLVMGNHDAGRSHYLRNIITRYFDDTIFSAHEAVELMKQEYPNRYYRVDNGCQVCHAPFTYWRIDADNRLFDEVYEGPLMISEKVLLSHEPANISWAYNIHGHNHNWATSSPTELNMCSDATGYKLLNLNQFYKNGGSVDVIPLHRQTIDSATIRKINKANRSK